MRERAGWNEVWISLSAARSLEFGGFEKASPRGQARRRGIRNLGAVLIKGLCVTSEGGLGSSSSLSATFLWVVGYFRMNNVLKVVLLILVAIIAVKLLPAMLAVGFMFGVAVVALGAIGVSVLGALCLASAVLLAVLSPVWVPVLAVVGLIALIKRSGRRTA